MIDYLEAWLPAEEINRSEVREQVEGELWVVSQCGEDRQRVFTVYDDGLVPVQGVAFHDLAGKGRFDLGDESRFRHLVSKDQQERGSPECVLYK